MGGGGVEEGVAEEVEVEGGVLIRHAGGEMLICVKTDVQLLSGGGGGGAAREREHGGAPRWSRPFPLSTNPH